MSAWEGARTSACNILFTHCCIVVVDSLASLFYIFKFSGRKGSHVVRERTLASLPATCLCAQHQAQWPCSCAKECARVCRLDVASPRGLPHVFSSSTSQVFVVILSSMLERVIPFESRKEAIKLLVLITFVLQRNCVLKHKCLFHSISQERALEMRVWLRNCIETPAWLVNDGTIE